MNEENVLSNVNSQSIVNDIETVLQHHNNALKQSITDFTQQTLIDVNSQPLIPVQLQDVIMSTQQDGDGQILATARTDNNNATPLDSSSPLLREFYEKFSAGKIYQTLEELRTTAYEYGRRHNVALTTSKSDKTKVYLICKHGGHYRKNVNKKRPPPKDDTKSIKTRIRKSQKNGCSCLIYARCCKNSFWTIRKSIGEHNHPIADDPRTYAMYRSLEPDQLSFVHKKLKESIGISNIVKSLTECGVNNIVAKDIENIQQDLKRKEALAAVKAAADAKNNNLL